MGCPAQSLRTYLGSANVSVWQQFVRNKDIRKNLTIAMAVKLGVCPRAHTPTLSAAVLSVWEGKVQIRGGTVHTHEGGRGWQDWCLQTCGGRWAHTHWRKLNWLS